MRVNTEALRVMGPQELLQGIVRDAQGIPIAQYENETSEVIRRELLPEVERVGDKTLAVLHPLASSDGEPEEAPRTGKSAYAFARRIDELIGHEDAVDHLGDLAFLARGELRSKLRRLRESGDLDSWELIGRAGSTVRKVVKTATALDLVLGDCTGVHYLDFETELEISLQVRRAYGKFRRHVNDFELGAVGGSAIEQALNNAATAIALLTGRDVYVELRVSDRVELRALQKRLMDWTVTSRHDARAGQRLLEDLRAFVELLSQVNHRQELREHDRKLLARLLDGGADEAETPGFRSDLDCLAGLDEELDQLLWGPRLCTPRDVRPVLERLAASRLAAAW